MKKSTIAFLLITTLLAPAVTQAQLLIFKGASTEAYVGEGHAWRVASKTILVIDYSTGNFGRIDYATIFGSKRYSTATYTNSHIVSVSGPNGKPYSAVTRIPTDCDLAEYPNREGLFFQGSNATLTITPGNSVSFPKTVTGGGRGFFYSSSSNQPVVSQGTLLGIFSPADSTARNQEGQTLDTAMVMYIDYVESMGYTR